MDNPAAPISSIPLQPAVSFPVESKNRPWLLWSAIGLIFLALGIAVGLFSAKFLSQSQDASPLTSTPSPTQSPASTPTPDPAAGWKIYSSTVFSFKYPQSLKLEERQKNYIVLLSDASNPQSVLVSVDARLTNNYANYDRAVSAAKSGLTNVQTEEMINGIKISGKVGLGYGEGQQIVIMLFKYQQGAVEAETTATNVNQLQVFDQILSTFKFLDQSEGNIYTGRHFSIDTSTWKLISDANQSPATPEVLETVSFANGQARMNVQVGTDSAEKVLASQDGNLTGKQILAGVEATKKSGYGGIAGSVYSVSLVSSYKEKTYLISFYTQDTKNSSEYEQSFNQAVSTFKFSN